MGWAEPSRRGKLDGVVLGTLDGVVDSLGVVDGVVLVVERLDPARGITINAGRVVSLAERARKCDLKAAAARLRSSGPINSWMFHGRPAGPCVVASFLEMPLRMVPLRGGGKSSFSARSATCTMWLAQRRARCRGGGGEDGSVGWGRTVALDGGARRIRFVPPPPIAAGAAAAAASTSQVAGMMSICGSGS